MKMRFYRAVSADVERTNNGALIQNPETNMSACELGQDLLIACIKLSWTLSGSHNLKKMSYMAFYPKFGSDFARDVDVFHLTC